MTTVPVRRLPHGEGLPLPAYATPHAAGLDLLAAVPEDEPLLLEPGRRALVPTGLCIELPEGFEAQVRPRSGLALRHGITLMNSPGTIDADYRGEVGVILVNLGEETFRVTRGMRVAQMVVTRFHCVALKESVELSETTRGVGGFGSTGLAERTRDT